MSTVSGGQGNIVTTGLVLNLDAANPRSYAPPFNGTTWQNIAPVSSSLSGSLVSGSFYTGSNGGSIVFDGVNDFVDCTGQLPSFNSVVTSEAWIYPTVLGGTRTILFHSGRYFQYFSDGNPGRIGSYWDGGYYYTPIGSIPLNTWSYACQVWDSPAASLKVYINGNLSLDQVIGTGNKSSGISGQIGMEGIDPNNLYARKFIGRIASVRLYNRPLSSSEVLQNFNATRARFGI